MRIELTSENEYWLTYLQKKEVECDSDELDFLNKERKREIELLCIAQIINKKNDISRRIKNIKRLNEKEEYFIKKYTLLKNI